MRAVLVLFVIQGVFGAFDTLYYHEYRAKLPARASFTAPELRLHASRDFIYTILFASLPVVTFGGAFAILLSVLIAAEIVITLADFVVEDRVRKPLGGVYPGERVTHALMGILYGAALSRLVPIIGMWLKQPTSLAVHSNLETLTIVMWMLAAGVFLSGVRDLAASYSPRRFAWPWAVES